MLLKLTTWGESHGAGIGGVLEGLPSGISIDIDYVQSEVDRRAPGRSPFTSPRQESDRVEVLSGIHQGKSLGSPIAFFVHNTDVRSQDYGNLSDTFRPGHADYTYHKKYGLRDARGGGRASARETVARVVAGALVRGWLTEQGIHITAFASRIGDVALPARHTSWADTVAHRDSLLSCPDQAVEQAMLKAIEQARQERDSIGGEVTCIAHGVPIGIGEPIYNKLSAHLASAMFSINAVRGFELGEGFHLSQMRGSEANDQMSVDASGNIIHLSNHTGGILGGISTGEDIVMRIAFKPTPTIGLEQQTVTTSGEPITLSAAGRHDPCVVPRAIPVVEAMCALTIGDMLLLHRAYQGGKPLP